ncbi:hypothetical protein VPNG_05393 [Cytospora leucostoma]|uniref:beta-glucosidase n=1 Tax=Cytospora leucostoma TaxID=1230097 RepID=A0A423X4G2_9PEZI|nr:hypothetical protein VPNG_05393 [Cytospora leucostoma]
MTESEPIEMFIAVSNIGGVDEPEKELIAFDKVFLQAGETKHPRIDIDKHAAGHYDTSLKAWIAEEGRFHVPIRASSVDIRQMVSFELKDPLTWIFR